MLSLNILIDNKALPGFHAEWGFAVSIEHKNNVWLWDAGASPLFIENAKKLQIDIKKAQGLAISHGHWDHTGGLSALQEQGYTLPLYMHPDGLKKKYALEPDGTYREIGIPGVLPKITEVHANYELMPGLTMFANITRLPTAFQAIQGFYSDQMQEKMVPQT